MSSGNVVAQVEVSIKRCFMYDDLTVWLYWVEPLNVSVLHAWPRNGEAA